MFHLSAGSVRFLLGIFYHRIFGGSVLQEVQDLAVIVRTKLGRLLRKTRPVIFLFHFFTQFLIITSGAVEVTYSMPQRTATRLRLNPGILRSKIPCSTFAPVCSTRFPSFSPFFFSLSVCLSFYLTSSAIRKARLVPYGKEKKNQTHFCILCKVSPHSS